MATGQNEDKSVSSWTIPSVVETQPTTGNDILTMNVIPQHDSIGLCANKNTTQVCVTVTAADLDEGYRASVDIVVSLDVSGSMNGDKINDCKQTLETMVRTLKSSDHFGLIIYSSHAQVLFPVTKMTPESKEIALRKINTIRTAGQTNLSGGLALASQEMRLISNPNSIQTIFLLTDGHANVGITRSEELQAMVRDFAFRHPMTPGTLPIQAGVRDMTVEDQSITDESMSTKPSMVEISARKAPISLVCFGYGTDHNSDMLSAIARETEGGAYYFIDPGSDSNISFAFGEAMGGILSVVAQSATLTISLPSDAREKGIKIVKVHHDQAILREEGMHSININDFYAEESRDVLVEVQLASLTRIESQPHAFVSLSYFDAVEGKQCTIGPVSCSISRPNNDKISPVNLHVEEQWVRLETIAQMNAARGEADANQFHSARERLQETIRSIRSKNHLKASYVEEMVKDVEEVISGLRTSMDYTQYGRHTMTNVAMQHTTQRSMGSWSPSMDNNASLSEPVLAMYSTRKRAMKAQYFENQMKEQKK